MTNIVFLRAVNVGGRNKISMAALKESLGRAGYPGARSFIQSGNLLLDYDDEDPRALAADVEEVIKKDFFLDITAFALSASRLKAILQNCPFKEDSPDEKGNLTYFTLFSDSLENENELNINQVKRFVRDSEKLVYSEKGVWLYCPEGYGRTKLSNTFLEKKLNLVATTRNRRTLKTMVRLSEEEQ